MCCTAIHLAEGFSLPWPASQSLIAVILAVVIENSTHAVPKCEQLARNAESSQKVDVPGSEAATTCSCLHA